MSFANAIKLHAPDPRLAAIDLFNRTFEGAVALRFLAPDISGDCGDGLIVVVEEDRGYRQFFRWDYRTLTEINEFQLDPGAHSIDGRPFKSLDWWSRDDLPPAYENEDEIEIAKPVLRYAQAHHWRHRGTLFPHACSNVGHFLVRAFREDETGILPWLVLVSRDHPDRSPETLIEPANVCYQPKGGEWECGIEFQFHSAKAAIDWMVEYEGLTHR